MPFSDVCLTIDSLVYPELPSELLQAKPVCRCLYGIYCPAEPKACGRPEQPPNSTTISGEFKVGASVEYSCDEGHLLVGPTVRTCLETGFFNEFPPVCIRKYIS